MKKLNLKQQLIKNVFWNSASTFISRVGALVFTIIIARFLMPEAFGIYTLAMSVAFLFMTVTDLGINRSMIRYVSDEIEKNKKKATAYFNYISRFKILASLISSSLLIILAYPLAYIIFNKPVLFFPLVFSALYIFIFSLDGFYKSVFFIKKKVKYVALNELVFQIFRIILPLASLFLIISTYYVLGVIIGLILTALISFFFILYYAIKIAPHLFNKSDIEIDKKRVLRFIGLITLSSVSAVFFSYIDTIMLGIFVEPGYIGYYKAAFSLVFGIAGILAFTNVLLPVFTQIESKKLKNISDKVMGYLMIIAIPASFGLAILSKYAIRLVFGYNYLPASLPLYFLSFLIIPSVGVGVFLTLFSAREKPEEFAKLTIFVTILNIILNYIFIVSLLKYSSLWAITGAAIATLISWYIYFIGTYIISKKKLKLQINICLLAKPLIAGLIMFFSLFIFNSFIGDMNLVYGLLEVGFGIIIYFIVLILIKGISKKDLELLTLLKG